MESKELLTITNQYVCKICECFQESRYIYGEIYRDIVFGVLVSTISDKEKRRLIFETALENNLRTDNAMCAALEREEIMEKAASTADEKSGAEAILELFMTTADNRTLNKIAGLLKEYSSKMND